MILEQFPEPFEKSTARGSTHPLYFVTKIVNQNLLIFQDEVRYMVTSVTDDGRNYFLLEETTGVLRTKKPLTSASQQYVVSIRHQGINFSNMV